jgi:protein-disulfide isomerase
MKHLPVLFLAAFVTLTMAKAAPATAQEKTPATAPSAAAIEKIIRDYLKKNPEIVVEAIEAHKQKQIALEEAAVKQALASRRDELNNDPHSVVGGNPNGDVTLVEFFDYRCGVCKRVHTVVAKMTERDKKIRRVYKEWPILGPGSIFAARAAIASRKQGDKKYLAFHDAMMESRQPLSGKIIMEIATRVGLDPKKLRKDMDAEEVTQTIQRNYSLAEALKLNGTPSFVIGDQLLRGARDIDTMLQMVRDARKKS